MWARPPSELPYSLAERYSWWTDISSLQSFTEVRRVHQAALGLHILWVSRMHALHVSSLFKRRPFKTHLCSTVRLPSHPDDKFGFCFEFQEGIKPYLTVLL